jgi:hypothetical protein
MLEMKICWVAKESIKELVRRDLRRFQCHVTTTMNAPDAED